MTDDLRTYGLGALPDPPDERDYPVSALYAAEGIEPSVALPASYAAPGMPPVLDQHATPMCVAYSSSAMRAWQDRRDQERTFDFDEPRFFREIGGTAAGAYVRDAMDRMRASGYPVVGSGDAGRHRIAAYYAVPRDPAAIKAAIHDLGPVVSRPLAPVVVPAARRRHAAGARRGGRRARDRRLRLGQPRPAPPQQLGQRLGDRRRLLDARRARPEVQRRVEGRGRDRAPGPVRAHGRRHRAAEPQRPQGSLATRSRSRPWVDPLIHHAEVLVLKGDSYRLRGKREEVLTGHNER